MESTIVVLSSKRPWIASFTTFGSIKTFLYEIDLRDRIISVKLIKRFCVSSIRKKKKKKNKEKIITRTSFFEVSLEKSPK